MSLNMNKNQLEVEFMKILKRFIDNPADIHLIQELDEIGIKLIYLSKNISNQESSLSSIIRPVADESNSEELNQNDLQKTNNKNKKKYWFFEIRKL
ncbi:unnamed protein product [Rotaria sordida]|uniref:Uncharacterized protein n=1 Tax=Rotaria sordida TaxID=392033 RepID=A0A815E2R6_9BILA|nr:unnamed protein product [Rotaria sordida]CAF1623066.1 unnamed protein product [Rotaria sordida]